MIDIHTHVLPGVDDGAADDDSAIRMLEMAVADGITTLACTPHIWPPKFPNTGPDIARRVGALQRLAEARGLPIRLVAGADAHIEPGLGSGLRDGTVPTLNGTDFFLLEPDHQVLTPQLSGFCQRLIAAGFRPILTHPERVGWIDRHFDVIQVLHGMGVVMQITAGSLFGEFGRRATQWAANMLRKRMVDVIASDAHGVSRRVVNLSRARDHVADGYGEELAWTLVRDNPGNILAGNSIIRAVA